MLLIAKLHILQCLFLPSWLLFLIAILAGCASTSEQQTSSVPKLPKVTQYALSLEGKPYRWGKASPEEGFDCSGFVQHVYEQHGVFLPRTVREMANTLIPVPDNTLHSGDLVFFNTNGKPYSHVGLYVNQDKFIHAPSHHSGKVHISSLKQPYWKQHFNGARRPR